jgi:hypothetical protein
MTFFQLRREIDILKNLCKNITKGETKMSRFFICLFVFINFQVFGQEIVRLDNAIQFVVQQTENDIKQGSSIAIMNFDSPSESFSNYVVTELTSLFAKNKKLLVTEQQKLDLVRQNEQYQLSGFVSDETMVRIGHNIGAQFIISGYLIDLGTTYRFGLYAIDMEKATRMSSSSVYLSGYDEQVVYLVTGNIKRPSEKTISANLTKASSKAAFMHTASTAIGNSLINRIPRNSTVAIVISGDFVAGDYFRNEINFILNNSNRFKVLDQKDIDLVLAEVTPDGANIVKSMVTEYEGFTESISQTQVGAYTDEQLQEIGESLGANIIIFGLYMDTEYVTNLENMEFAELIFRIKAIYVNSLQEISKSDAYWSWPEGVEYIE